MTFDAFLLPLFAQQPGQVLALIGLGFVGLLILLCIGVFMRFFPLWIQSVMAGAGVTIWDLIGMTFRKVNPDVIVRSKIMTVQAGLDDRIITTKSLEAHYLAGGRVPVVIRAMVAASKAKLTDLDYKLATAIDLAGRDVLEAVQTSVYPKVIDCPAASKGRVTLDGVAKNGIHRCEKSPGVRRLESSPTNHRSELPTRPHFFRKMEIFVNGNDSCNRYNPYNRDNP